MASVFYGIGHRLDQEPELIFALRGVDPTELIAGTADSLISATGSGGEDVLEGEDLSAIFGIELDHSQAALDGAPQRAALRDDGSQKDGSLEGSEEAFKRISQDFGSDSFQQASGESTPLDSSGKKPKKPKKPRTHEQISKTKITKLAKKAKAAKEVLAALEISSAQEIKWLDERWERARRADKEAICKAERNEGPEAAKALKEALDAKKKKAYGVRYRSKQALKANLKAAERELAICERNLKEEMQWAARLASNAVKLSAGAGEKGASAVSESPAEAPKDFQAIKMAAEASEEVSKDFQAAKAPEESQATMAAEEAKMRSDDLPRPWLRSSIPEPSPEEISRAIEASDAWRAKEVGAESDGLPRPWLSKPAFPFPSRLEKEAQAKKEAQAALEAQVSHSDIKPSRPWTPPVSQCPPGETPLWSLVRRQSPRKEARNLGAEAQSPRRGAKAPAPGELFDAASKAPSQSSLNPKPDASKFAAEEFAAEEFAANELAASGACLNLSLGSLCGRDIRYLRKRAGLSVSELAGILKVTSALLLRCESVDGVVPLQKLTARNLHDWGKGVLNGKTPAGRA